MMKKLMNKVWEKKDSKKGFTLVELIVVLVILGILMAILIPSMVGWIDKAKEKQVSLNARTVVMAAQSAQSDAYGELTARLATPEEVEAYLENGFPGFWTVTVSADFKTVEQVIYAKDSVVITYTPQDGYKTAGTAPSDNTVVAGK